MNGRQHSYPSKQSLPDSNGAEYRNRWMCLVNKLSLSTYRKCDASPWGGYQITRYSTPNKSQRDGLYFCEGIPKWIGVVLVSLYTYLFQASFGSTSWHTRSMSPRVVIIYESAPKTQVHSHAPTKPPVLITEETLQALKLIYHNGN